MTEEYHTDIRMKATRERLKSLILKTELMNNVKILSHNINSRDFTCKIIGPKIYVEKAKIYLDELFNVSL